MGEDGDRDQIVTAGQCHPGFISAQTSANAKLLGPLVIQSLSCQTPTGQTP